MRPPVHTPPTTLVALGVLPSGAPCVPHCSLPAARRLPRACQDSAAVAARLFDGTLWRCAGLLKRRETQRLAILITRAILYQRVKRLRQRGVVGVGGGWTNLCDPCQQLVASFEGAAHFLQREAARQLVFTRGRRLGLLRPPISRLRCQDS